MDIIICSTVNSCPTEPVPPHQYVKKLKATMEGAYEKAREHLKAIQLSDQKNCTTKGCMGGSFRLGNWCG